MKITSILIVLLVGASLISSCKKRDKIAPVITLNGEKEQVVSLNAAYVESGATAKDNKSGDITASIVISGTVNENKVGEYRKFYDVEDENGNKAATAIRFVNVVNNADYMLGTYMATPNCAGTGTTNYNTSITASQTVNNRIYIKRVLFLVEDDPIVADINGTVITIPLQTVGYNTVEGSGTISGTQFLVDVTVNGSYSCTIDHTKI